MSALDNGLFLLGEFSHLGLDLGEVGGGYGVTVGVDVVVESVFNGRGLCRTSRPVELLESFGEKVGRTVPESVLAFRSSHLKSFISASLLMGRLMSHSSPLTVAARMSWAKRELMLSAICSGVVPASYCLELLSGNVIVIIVNRYSVLRCFCRRGTPMQKIDCKFT